MLVHNTKMKSSIILLIPFLSLINLGSVSSFSPVVPISTERRISSTIPSSIRYPIINQRSKESTTALRLLLDVPDNFFAVTFFGMGILLNISKNFARVRMEERAWEQRLEEARLERLRQDPTLTEIDLRRKEAAMEWSAYGKPRMEEEAERLKRRSRVKVMEDRVEEQPQEERRQRDRSRGMTDEEIEAFEVEFGVEYDPYYDDPYTEEELPEGKFSVDKMYGDRIYENGEIFYKDAQTGLFYRQGCKPRNLSFWG